MKRSHPRETGGPVLNLGARVCRLSYTREGNTLRLLTSHNTRWWLNFRDGPAIVTVPSDGGPGAALALKAGSSMRR